MQTQKGIAEALTMLLNGFDKVTKSTKILATGGRSNIELNIYPKKGEAKAFYFTPDEYDELVSAYDKLKPDGPAL